MALKDSDTDSRRGARRRSCAKMTVMEGFGSLSDAWERHAARWERWTRVIRHDVY
jgi:hypothetical protein